MHNSNEQKLRECGQFLPKGKWLNSDLVLKNYDSIIYLLELLNNLRDWTIKPIIPLN